MCMTESRYFKVLFPSSWQSPPPSTHMLAQHKQASKTPVVETGWGWSSSPGSQCAASLSPKAGHQQRTSSAQLAPTSLGRLFAFACVNHASPTLPRSWVNRVGCMEVLLGPSTCPTAATPKLFAKSKPAQAQHCPPKVHGNV